MATAAEVANQLKNDKQYVGSDINKGWKAFSFKPYSGDQGARKNTEILQERPEIMTSVNNN